MKTSESRLHRSRDVLDWHIRVNTVLIEQVDRFDPEALERGLGDLLDVRGPTIQAALFATLELEPELGCNHHLTTHRGQRFADELFVGERAIRFGRVEERHASFDREPNQGNHLLSVSRRTVTKAHSHTTEPERRDFQVAVAECALLHCV